MTLRTWQRWVSEGVVKVDGRTTAQRPTPANALSADERNAILAVCNSGEHADLPPSQIVPRLADKGLYLASERTFYRVLQAADQQHRRGRSQKPQRHPVPTTHTASAPNQVWSWDITYCVPGVQGKHGCLNGPRTYLKFANRITGVC